MSAPSVKHLHELACEWTAESRACLAQAAKGHPHYSHLYRRLLTLDELRVRAGELAGCADDLLKHLPVPYCNQSSPVES